MARDDADIDRLKAEIPDRYQPPRDAGGMLTNQFSSVDSLRESTPLQGSGPSERDLHNLGLRFVAASADNPNQTSPGFLLSGALASALQIQIAKTERGKHDDEQRFVLAQLISQIEARNRQIEENIKRLAILDRQETALQEQLARLRSGEKAELDENGRLRNKDAEAAIHEYEQRYGVTVDRNDGAQIATILRGVQDEKLYLQRDNERLERENEQDRQLAIRMGADPASIPATVRTAQETDAGRRSVNAATASLDSYELKRRVVDAKPFDANDRALALEEIANQATDFEETAQVIVPAGVSAASQVEPAPIKGAPDAAKAFGAATANAVANTVIEPEPAGKQPNLPRPK